MKRSPSTLTRVPRPQAAQASSHSTRRLVPSKHRNGLIWHGPQLVYQKKAQDQREVSVSPTAGFGYGSGSGYDPATGTQRRGGVAVTIASPGGEPGSSEKDREVRETERNEKGLPEGATPAPVAGYFYFPIFRTRMATHQLEYRLNGNNGE